MSYPHFLLKTKYPVSCDIVFSWFILSLKGLNFFTPSFEPILRFKYDGARICETINGEKEPYFGRLQTNWKCAWSWNKWESAWMLSQRITTKVCIKGVFFWIIWVIAKYKVKSKPSFKTCLDSKRYLWRHKGCNMLKCFGLGHFHFKSNNAAYLWNSVCFS